MPRNLGFLETFPVLAALPTSSGSGRIVTLSTDGHPYFDHTTGWRLLDAQPPAVPGDMLKSTYDTNNDGRIDAGALGTGTPTALTYLNGTNAWVTLPGMLNAQDSRLDSVIPRQSLTALQAAIASGTVVDCWLGESVTEGGNNLRPTDNYREIVVAELKQILPNVTWTQNNIALGARNVGQFADANFKGLAAEPADLTTGFGPRGAGDRPWVVVGKSWLQHARDLAPDVLFLPWGINMDYSTYESVDKFARGLDSVIAQVNTWPKIPTIVLITTNITQLSNTSGQPLWRATARLMRQAAAKNGLALIDPHRRWSMARDLIDPAVRVSSRVNDWDTWTFPAGAWSRSGTTMTPVAATGLLQFPVVEDAELTVSATFSGASTQLLRIYVRASVQSAYMVQMNSGGGTLYRRDYSGALTSLGNLGNYPAQGTAGAPRVLKVTMDGQRFVMTMDGVSLIDVSTPLVAVEGNIQIGNDQASYTPPILSSVTVIRRDGGNLPGLGTSEVVLLGDGSGFDGNGINHPTSFGHRMVIAPPFRGLYEAVTAPLIGPNVKVITANFAAIVQATNTVYAVNAAGAAVTGTLPSASLPSSQNREITVKKTDSSANTVTVAAQSGQTIDGGASAVIGAQYTSLTVVSDGSNWVVI